MPVTRQSNHLGIFLRWLGLCLIALLGLCIVLAIDLSPVVPIRPEPTAEQASLVRQRVQQVQMQLRGNDGRASIDLSHAELAGLTAMASALKKFGRVDAVVADNSLTIWSSRQFGFVWLNSKATIAPSLRGFPATHLQIGDLPLGAQLSRWLLDRVVDRARRREIQVPALDDLVRSVRFDANAVRADIHVPLGGAFANDIAKLRSQPVDARRAASIYCRLRAENAKAPTSEMTVLVQRAFADQSGASAVVDENRAALVALAMYVVSPEAGRLAGDATQRVRTCRGANGETRLAGRSDLASHWALSAALAVSLGPDIGRALGEWKELSDSRPGGSGFSFVDLAADRAGLAFARLASDPATAGATARNLRAATTEYLLPVRALALSEGLTEQQFVSQFTALDSAQFSAATSRIDAVLAKTEPPSR